MQKSDDAEIAGLKSRYGARTLALIAVVAVVNAIILFAVLPAAASIIHASLNSNVYPDGYNLLASNLVAGNGYRFYPDTARTLMREPGYPILLAGLFSAFGERLVAVELMNLLLALATAWLAVEIARRLLSGKSDISARRLLHIAPLVWLFHPGTLIAESRGGVEIPFAFLLTFFVWTFLRAVNSENRRAFVFCGAILGVTVLVRSTPLLLPGFLFPYLLLMEGGKKRIIQNAKNIAAMIATMLIILSPWIARNFMVTGKFVPTASVLGVSAQAGQYIGKHLFDGESFWLLDRKAARERDRVAEQLGLPFEDGNEGYYQTFYKSQDEIEFSRVLFERVLQTYKQDPLLFARCISQNMLGFWVAGKTWAITAVTAVLQIPYLLLAGFGAFVGLKSERREMVGIVFLVILYTMAVHAPLLAQARYSVPLNPLVSVLVWLGVSRLRGHRVASSDCLGRLEIVRRDAKSFA